jgi:hypothetical protein
MILPLKENSRLSVFPVLEEKNMMYLVYILPLLEYA